MRPDPTRTRHRPDGRIWVWITVVAVISGGGLAGCGEDAESDQRPEHAPGESTTGQGGELAGTLHATPSVVEPGAVIRVEVENRGSKPFSYSLHNRAERYVDGTWERAFGPQIAPDVLFRVRPGERKGPAYPDGPLVDQVELPADLEPGIYRIVKDHGPGFTLAAEFEVRPPGE